MPPGFLQRARQRFDDGVDFASRKLTSGVSRADKSIGLKVQSWRSDYNQYKTARNTFSQSYPRMATPPGQTQAYRLSTESRELGNMAFLVLAGLSLGPFIMLSFRGNMPAGLGYTMLIISFVGFFIGLVGGREARPGVGVIVVMFALLTFSYSYSDVVGQALFGYYWPAVEKFGEGTFKPASMAFARSGCTFSASMSCITEGPVACEQSRLLCERTQSQAEGSELAIEFGDVQFFPKTLEPDQPTSGSVIIENRGDWDAKNVALSVEDPKIERVISGRPESATIGAATIVSCTGGDLEGGKCVFPGAMPKDGKGAAQFSITWSNLRDPEDRGNFARVSFVANYHYDVQAAYHVDARSSEALRTLLAGAPIPAGKEAIYSGGPVRAAFWTSQYVEGGKPTLVAASLSNTKEGTVSNSVFCIYLPADSVTFCKEDACKWSRTASSSDIPDCSQDIPNTKVVECSIGDLKPVGTVTESGNSADSKTCNFWIIPDTGGQPEKRLDIVGEAGYDYKVEDVNKDVQFPATGQQFTK